MKAQLTCIALVAAACSACQTSRPFDEDTGIDTATDTGGGDTSTDVHVDTDAVDAPDTPDTADLADAPDTADTAWDPDGTDSTDTTDAPADVPTEIGMPCTSDEECDDGVYCDGVEYCHPTGVCARTPSVDCDDGIDCTLDSCNEATDGCDHPTDDASCADADLCTEDRCDAATDSCVHDPVDCADGVTCTLDACVPASGACTHTVSNAACDDADACTTDTCTVATDTCRNVLLDSDGDGYPPASCGGSDCNDASAAIHPGATEVCSDGIDQDCDGIDGGTGSCSCPIAIGVPGYVSGSTTTGASAYQGACAYGTGGNELIHRLVLAETTTLRFTATGSGSYPYLYIRQGSCSGTELGCVSYSPGTLDVTLGAGTYFVFVDAYSSSYGGTYELSVRESFTPTAVTGNDTCATAWHVTAEGSFSGSNVALTDTAVGSCDASTGGHDAWFWFTLAASRTVTLDTSGSSFDTVLYARQATCTGTEAGCDDDGGVGNTSLLTRTLAAGTYYVVVDGYYATSTGTYLLTVTGL